MLPILLSSWDVLEPSLNADSSVQRQTEENLQHLISKQIKYSNDVAGAKILKGKVLEKHCRT